MSAILSRHRTYTIRLDRSAPASAVFSCAVMPLESEHVHPKSWPFQQQRLVVRLRDGEHLSWQAIAAKVCIAKAMPEATSKHFCTPFPRCVFGCVRIPVQTQHRRQQVFIFACHFHFAFSVSYKFLSRYNGGSNNYSFCTPFPLYDFGFVQSAMPKQWQKQQIVIFVHHFHLTISVWPSGLSPATKKLKSLSGIG